MRFFAYTGSRHVRFDRQNLEFVQVITLAFIACVLFLMPHQVVTAQTVHIPDAGLRAALESALGKEAGASITQVDMAGLKTLEAVRFNISNLTGLESATNLKKLDLEGNSISDISPLKDLENLTKLRLGKNRRISNVSPLKDLENLTFLDLDGNQISDISPLKDLKNLTWIDLDGNQISNVSPLKDLENLEFLDIDSNQISDVSPLKDLMTNLIWLDLDDNHISDVSPLKDLKNLTYLDLEVNQISDVSPLSALINLTELDLHDNQISDVSPLSTLTNLKALDLESNEISNLSSLKNMTNLTTLNLRGNEISDVSPLSTLINLRILDLRGNEISDFSPIVGLMQNLEEYYADAPTIKTTDVNRDGIVNIVDIILAASNFDTPDLEALAGMNIYPDVNRDGLVDIRDLMLIAAEIGAAAAPTFNDHSVEITNLTSEELTEWIRLAEALDTDDLQMRQGLAVLEQLLAVLTLSEAFPRETALLANYPNPFNPETWIPYELSKPAVVNISIHSVDGQLVRELVLGHLPAGIYHNKSRAVYWDGRNDFGESVASGIYFYTLSAADFTATRKMIIRK